MVVRVSYSDIALGVRSCLLRAPVFPISGGAFPQGHTSAVPLPFVTCERLPTGFKQFIGTQFMGSAPRAHDRSRRTRVKMYRERTRGLPVWVQ